MVGETVYVETRAAGTPDRFNAPTYTYSETQVDNVLVSPGTSQDVTDSNRPEGVEVNYTLYFPKAYTGSLEGLRVKVRGNYYHVIGCPDRYSPCPTNWNMTVMVGRVNG